MKNNIVGYGVPLPVSGEPEHAAAKTPVVRSTGHNDAVETSLSHLGPKRAVAPLVFASGETLVDRVAIVWRLDHVVEKPPVVEAISDLGKWITGHRSISRFHRVRDTCSLHLATSQQFLSFSFFILSSFSKPSRVTS